MKIYVGKNKSKARLIDFKSLLAHVLTEGLNHKKDDEVSKGRLGDDSASWVNVRVPIKNNEGIFDIEINFDPEDDNIIESVQIFKSLYVLDEQNMTELT